MVSFTGSRILSDIDSTTTVRQRLLTEEFLRLHVGKASSRGLGASPASSKALIDITAPEGAWRYRTLKPARMVMVHIIMPAAVFSRNRRNRFPSEPFLEVCFPQRAPNPPEFAQSRLSRSIGGHPQRGGANLGVFVPIWLVLPRCGATNLGVFDLCHVALLKRGCANSGGFGAR